MFMTCFFVNAETFPDYFRPRIPAVRRVLIVVHVIFMYSILVSAWLSYLDLVETGQLVSRLRFDHLL